MSKKQQASSSKLETTIRILHEEWALNQGLRSERQAASSDPDTPQGVGPGAGLPGPEQQASSRKHQAPSSKRKRRDL